MGQPALSLAAQLLRRAERAGAPAELALPHLPGLPDASGAVDSPADQAAGSDLGRELFALVGRARAEGLDPELELRAAALAYSDRVRAWEASKAG